MSVVVVSHLPGEGHFTSSVHQVQPIECDGDFDYWRGLTEVWDSEDTVVIVEHDMEASDELIQRLLSCPHPLCTYAYLLHWVSTGKPEPLYAHRSAPAHQLGQYIDERVGWVDFTGIGFCKITSAARGAPVAEAPWQHVDVAANNAVAGPWHLHWPAVEHYHR